MKAQAEDNVEQMKRRVNIGTNGGWRWPVEVKVSRVYLIKRAVNEDRSN